MNKFASPEGLAHSRPEPAQRGQDPAAAPRVASTALLQGARHVEISHNGVVYRLQATRLGKLILTK